MLDSPWLRLVGILFTAVVLIPLFWCFVVWLLSRFSGWGGLARKYESNRRFEGDIRRWQSARIGGVKYNHVITLTQMEDGLGITPMPLFSAGHVPLLIPWKAISYEGRKQVFFMTVDVFQLGETHPVSFKVVPGAIDLERLQPSEKKPSH